MSTELARVIQQKFCPEYPAFNKFVIIDDSNRPQWEDFINRAQEVCNVLELNEREFVDMALIYVNGKIDLNNPVWNVFQKYFNGLIVRM
jgi:hypothetical protein